MKVLTIAVSRLFTHRRSFVLKKFEISGSEYFKVFEPSRKIDLHRERKNVIELNKFRWPRPMKLSFVTKEMVFIPLYTLSDFYICPPPPPHNASPFISIIIFHIFHIFNFTFFKHFILSIFLIFFHFLFSKFPYF